MPELQELLKRISGECWWCKTCGISIATGLGLQTGFNASLDKQHSSTAALQSPITIVNKQEGLDWS